MTSKTMLKQFLLQIFECKFCLHLIYLLNCSVSVYTIYNIFKISKVTRLVISPSYELFQPDLDWLHSFVSFSTYFREECYPQKSVVKYVT